MSELNYYDRIESYMDGQQSTVEKKAFEEELLTNPSLKEEYEAYLATVRLVDSLAYYKLKEKAVQIAEKKTARRIHINRRLLSAAAAVLVLMGLGTWWYAQTNYSNEALYATYYELPNLESVRGEVDSDAAYMQAIIAFRDQQLDSAIRLMAGIPADSSIYPTAQYYLGHFYLEANRPQEAIATFEALLAWNDQRFQANVEWKLIMCYLLVANESKLTALLNKIISDNNHPYHRLGEQLQQKLSTFWRVLTPNEQGTDPLMVNDEIGEMPLELERRREERK